MPNISPRASSRKRLIMPVRASTGASAGVDAAQPAGLGIEADVLGAAHGEAAGDERALHRRELDPEMREMDHRPLLQGIGGGLGPGAVPDRMSRRR